MVGEAIGFFLRNLPALFVAKAKYLRRCYAVAVAVGLQNVS